jgi:hypothetical protein
MNYNFLETSQFIIVDYVPGSSGQLFLRLWSELDSRIDNNSTEILKKSINEHKSSTEVSYDIVITKKIVNWFLEKAEPSCIEEYFSFFEFLGNFLVAKTQPWNPKSKTRFLENGKDINYSPIVLYAMHTKDNVLPKEIYTKFPKLKVLSIVPKTDIGKRYQLNRAEACYNQRKNTWSKMILDFNNKEHNETFDFCTMLATKDSNAILNYLETKIGKEFFLKNKVDKVQNILNDYYTVVVNNLEI